MCVTNGRFPDFAPRNAPSRLIDSGLLALLIMGLTVAGTAPDLHRIPFYAVAAGPLTSPFGYKDTIK